MTRHLTAGSKPLRPSVFLPLSPPFLALLLEPRLVLPYEPSRREAPLSPCPRLQPSSPWSAPEALLPFTAGAPLVTAEGERAPIKGYVYVPGLPQWTRQGRGHSDEGHGRHTDHLWATLGKSLNLSGPQFPNL